MPFAFSPLESSQLRAHDTVIREYFSSPNSSCTSSQLNVNKLLVLSQPQFVTNIHRRPLLDFLFKVAIRTKVYPTNFHHAVYLFDLYCSSRVLLLDQVQLVACTCLWLACKYQGGANHIVNSIHYTIPNREVSKRSRIPRLTEFIQLCGPQCGYSEKMFISSEFNILKTLNWSLNHANDLSPFVFLDAAEFMIGFEERIINDNDPKDAAYSDMRALFHIKRFIIDLTTYNLDLCSQVPPELLSKAILKLLCILILNDDGSNDVSSNYHSMNLNTLESILSIYNSINDCPESGDINEIVNSLICEAANASTAITSHYLSSNSSKINTSIKKLHDACVSHMLAINEEQKEKQSKEIYFSATILEPFTPTSSKHYIAGHEGFAVLGSKESNTVSATMGNIVTSTGNSASTITPSSTMSTMRINCNDYEQEAGSQSTNTSSTSIDDIQHHQEIIVSMIGTKDEQTEESTDVVSVIEKDQNITIVNDDHNSDLFYEKCYYEQQLETLHNFQKQLQLQQTTEYTNGSNFYNNDNGNNTIENYQKPDDFEGGSKPFIKRYKSSLGKIKLFF